MAPPKGYPVEWQGKTYYLGALSAGVKNAFAMWTKPRALRAAAKVMAPQEYQQYRQEIVGIDDDEDEDTKSGSRSGGCFWSASPAMVVTEALKTKAGMRQLNRLLFGDQVKGMSDADLWAMLKAKDKKLPTKDDPNPVQSDYAIAFDLVWEEQDPKASRPSDDTEGQEDTTNLSTTSPPTTQSESAEPKPTT